ncbi:MAG: UbiX family flavin prenyltransferase [Candidatus Thermoplasmatota archaeon]|nr:UbiX family flavin prenyltransferase [Candidatus Thermoplasmatota archaeon]
MKILVSIGGASGIIYGIKLLEELAKTEDEIHLIITGSAKKIMQYETNHPLINVKKLADFFYDDDNLFAGPASGSFQIGAMIIVPCSIKTLSAIANGYCETLTARSAMCCLKEGKKVILVLRETPLDLATLKNMVSAKQNGAVILPAMPSFYHKPQKIEEIIDFIVGKILDQLGISHSLYKKWA